MGARASVVLRAAPEVVGCLINSEPPVVGAGLQTLQDDRGNALGKSVEE